MSFLGLIRSKLHPAYSARAKKQPSQARTPQAPGLVSQAQAQHNTRAKSTTPAKQQPRMTHAEFVKLSDRFGPEFAAECYEARLTPDQAMDRRLDRLTAERETLQADMAAMKAEYAARLEAWGLTEADLPGDGQEATGQDSELKGKALFAANLHLPTEQAR